MLGLSIIYIMKRATSKEWTEAENDLLLEYYYTMSERTLREILPGRTPKEIQKQVALLTRKNKHFSRW